MGLLQKLVQNSINAIEEGVYEIVEELPNSKMDLLELMKNNKHASLITEIKFSSPSLGKIREYANPVTIAESMLNGGAKGISVLTQPYLFNGSPKYFIQIRKAVSAPLLMKDIVVDKIQIDAAKKIGADYILLIESLFDKGLVKEKDEMIAYAHNKGLKILLESHTKKEFEESLQSDADILGINNRNLDTLELDLNTTKKILSNYKSTKFVIAESGINSPQDIRFLYEAGANAFLVGSSIMKNHNIKESVQQLVNAI